MFLFFIQTVEITIQLVDDGKPQVLINKGIPYLETAANGKVNGFGYCINFFMYLQYIIARSITLLLLGARLVNFML